MLTDGKDEKQITVNLEGAFNPYEDKTLTATQPDVPILNQREPFNDAIKHMDIIAGQQRNRTLSDYPRRVRPWVRLYAIIALLLFALGIILDIFQW